MIDLSARCWQLEFPEPRGSGSNDTKVPASAGLFASNYSRIPADAVPVYHGPRGLLLPEPLFRQMTSMRAVESLASHQPQRRSSRMLSSLIAAGEITPRASFK